MGLKDIVKKCILTAGLAGTLLLGSKEVKAQEINLYPYSEEPEHKVVLDLTNHPLDDFEANTDFWFSLSQMVNSSFKKSEKFDSGERFITVLADFYLSGMFQHYAHEVSHGFIDRKYGEKHGFEITFLDMNYSWLLPVPEFVQHPLENWENIFTKKEVFNTMTFGLNTDEYSSKKYWRSMVLNQSNPHALDTLSYLVTKFSDMSYTQGVGFEDKRNATTGLTMLSLIEHIRTVNDTPNVNDIDFYTQFLYNDGIDMTKKKYFKQILISDLLSWSTWESFGSIYRYIKDGTTRYKPFTFKFRDNEITPPLINLYLTPKGSFFDFTSFVNPHKKHPLELSLGFSDSFGDKIRFGGKIYDLGNDKFKFSPFAYLNFEDGLEGFSLGTEWQWYLKNRTFKKLALRSTLEYNDDDILSDIKGQEEFRATAGLEYRF